MDSLTGLIGLRPTKELINRITCPPYDVIKAGSELEKCLKDNPESLYHITLGNDPKGALERLISLGHLMEEPTPSFYVYEQTYNGQIRTGVLAGVKVTHYREGKIIRHEKTFDDKVKGRLELRRKTGYTFEPVFLLTRTKITPILERIKAEYKSEYEFVSDFGGNSELHAIHNRIFRVSEDSTAGRELRKIIGDSPLYIADGHHRYHASLLNGQNCCLAYICETDQANIQAYNRVINGPVSFENIMEKMQLAKMETFKTPPKHSFAIYSKKGNFLLKAERIPDDVVKGLDCSILEKELYPDLGLSHEMINDQKYFDYYPESDLSKMQELVDSGKYNLAVALHPVSVEELLAVADQGVWDSAVVMPEKSTFFAPKILSGIFIFRHKVIAGHLQL